MSVSLQYLQRCSAQKGYAVLPLEKVIRLGEMAGDIARHPLPTYTRSRLEALITERAVMEQLVPMLAVDAFPRADDLVKRAWAVLSDFMTLQPNEVAYITSIEHGELRPELLFPDDPEAAQRIAEHPAILWKVTNVREHLARRTKKHNGAVSLRDAP